MSATRLFVHCVGALNANGFLEMIIAGNLPLALLAAMFMVLALFAAERTDI